MLHIEEVVDGCGQVVGDGGVGIYGHFGVFFSEGNFYLSFRWTKWLW